MNSLHNYVFQPAGNMASKMTSMGYSASSKVYNAMATRMPNLNPIPSVRGAVVTKFNMMITPQWDWTGFEMGSDSEVFGQEDQEVYEQDTKEQVRYAGFKGSKDSKPRLSSSNAQSITSHDVINKFLAFSSLLQYFFKRAHTLSRRVLGSTSLSSSALIAMAAMVAVSMVSLGILGALFVVVEVAMISLAFVGVLMVIGSVTLMGVLCTLLLLYKSNANTTL